jgi:hypothetical protein
MITMKWILGLVVIMLCAFAWGGYVLAVEEPAFRSVLKDGPYEVRDYPALVVAETTVSGGQKEAAGQGFRRLAGYIFGGNRSVRKIAMTAPVAQQPTSEKIAMTAPVGQTLTGEGWIVRFTMPSGYTLATLPEPSDPLVRLRETAPARFAVVRFSGLARPDDVSKQTSWLSTWMAQHKLAPSGPATLEQYNPPWTLWFLRRNEVMIPVAP